MLNYDTNASPIRAVQRSGRTGRSRPGRVVHLLAAGKEERQFERPQHVRRAGIFCSRLLPCFSPLQDPVMHLLLVVVAKLALPDQTAGRCKLHRWDLFMHPLAGRSR